MSLSRYRAKRDFAETPEPAGDGRAGDAAPTTGGSSSSSTHATRLHWDLRLEHDGVLASWAMPNGIPPDPADNRLAVRTEDHPLEYLEFHGEIPKGQYGAGTMTIWDAGTYELHKWEPAQGRGHVPRRAAQRPLRAVPDRARRGGQAGLDDPPDGSARRSRPGADARADRADDGARRRRSPSPSAGGRSRSSGTGSARSPTCSRAGCDWRAATSTRSPTPIPRSAGLVAQLGMHEAVLDGEIVAFDEDGRPSFERLQRRMHVTSPNVDPPAGGGTPVVYAIFDLLYLDGHSLMELPYRERRERARGARAGRPGVAGARRASAATASDCWRRPSAQGLEGVVAKRLDSRYEPGRRTGAWLKIKHTRRQELVIGGWIPGEGRRARADRRAADGLLPATASSSTRGASEPGSPSETLDELRGQLEPLRRADIAVRPAPKLPREAVFVEPELVAEIEFREWTARRGDARAVVQGPARRQAAARGGAREPRSACCGAPPPGSTRRSRAPGAGCA